MAQYRVLQSSSLRVTLEDGAGRQHIARALQDAPMLGAELHGPHAARGFAILSHGSTERQCHVIFEEVNCGRNPIRSGPSLQ